VFWQFTIIKRVGYMNLAIDNLNKSGKLITLLLRIEYRCFSFIIFKGSYSLFCNLITGSKVVLQLFPSYR